MNGHGGARPGTGRKKGSATQKTREVAVKAAAEGITPLEVMLKAMRAYDQAGDTVAACAVAKDAAPYIHARLAAIAVDGKVGFILEVAEEIVESHDDLEDDTEEDRDLPGTAEVQEE